MAHRLFLSHDSSDHNRAEILARAINRITLNQLIVWHSSDCSGGGGLKPGNVWLDEIRTRLSQSRAVVVLLTKRSLSKPWVLFESGFGAANPQCDVIPVCVGIDSLSDVPFPLAMYQAYQLSDYASLKRFTEKLLNSYEISFDEEMAKPVLVETIKLLVKEDSEAEKAVQSSHPDRSSMQDAVVEIKEHLDKRLIGLLSSGLIASGDSATSGGWYSVPIEIDFPNLQTTQHLEIGRETSLQEVLDNVYQMLNDIVEPFTYMKDWIIKEVHSRKNMVVREVANWIPATAIFTESRRWKVIPLTQPYSPEDSTDVDRWYYS